MTDGRTAGQRSLSNRVPFLAFGYGTLKNKVYENRNGRSVSMTLSAVWHKFFAELKLLLNRYRQWVLLYNTRHSLSFINFSSTQRSFIPRICLKHVDLKKSLSFPNPGEGISNHSDSIRSKVHKEPTAGCADKFKPQYVPNKLHRRVFNNPAELNKSLIPVIRKIPTSMAAEAVKRRNILLILA